MGKVLSSTLPQPECLDRPQVESPFITAPARERLPPEGSSLALLQSKAQMRTQKIVKSCLYMFP